MTPSSISREPSSILYVVLVVFFFQAEDGIRDYKVTGVQTCALPIYLAVGSDLAIAIISAPEKLLGEGIHHHVARPGVERDYLIQECIRLNCGDICNEIGRASCRERV